MIKRSKDIITSLTAYSSYIIFLSPSILYPPLSVALEPIETWSSVIEAATSFWYFQCDNTESI